MKSKERKEKRRNRSKSKDSKQHYDKEDYDRERLAAHDEEDVFGLNNLRDKLINKKKKRPNDNVSMPTGVIDQDVLEQQQETIKMLTAELEKQRRRGKDILKELSLINAQLDREKQYLKIQSRVK